MTTTVITGTTNGIGLATARVLAKNQHRLLMLCRNLKAAEAVMPPFEGILSSEEIEAVAYFISANAGH